MSKNAYQIVIDLNEGVQRAEKAIDERNLQVFKGFEGNSCAYVSEGEDGSNVCCVVGSMMTKEQADEIRARGNNTNSVLDLLNRGIIVVTGYQGEGDPDPLKAYTAKDHVWMALSFLQSAHDSRFSSPAQPGSIPTDVLLKERLESVKECIA